MTKTATALLFIAAMVALSNLARTSTVIAAPAAQSTATPTDEPAKPPYVFPVPVFIPTYPGDTPSAPVAPRTPVQATGQDTYTVQSSDSPWTIAQKVYGDGTKYPLIMSANGLTSTTRLRVGTVLKIPLVAGAPPASASTPLASAPTSLPATPAAIATIPTTVSRTPSATPIALPARGLSQSASDIAMTAINLVASLLILGAVIAAVLAFFAYRRTRRMQDVNPPKRGLHIRQ